MVTACATFPLIFLGGMVTSKHAGLSVPDWPNSYGYNMFTFPPSRWVGGIFFEHTHRLLASLVGLLSIILTVVAFRTEARRPVRWLAAGVLGAVIVQGILGGLRVVLVNLDLAMAHACLAQICFCLAAVLCVVTSRRWFTAGTEQTVDAAPLLRVARLTVACVIIQLLLGIVMRHEQAGLAIPDLPLTYGQLIPPTTPDQLVTRIDQWPDKSFVSTYGPFSLFQVWINFAHRAWATVVVVVTIALAGTILLRYRRAAGGWLFMPAVALIALLVLQVSLGIATVLMRKPADIASAHVATGALLLMTAVVVLTRAVRIDAIAQTTSHPRRTEARQRAQFRGATIVGSGA